MNQAVLETPRVRLIEGVTTKPKGRVKGWWGHIFHVRRVGSEDPFLDLNFC